MCRSEEHTSELQSHSDLVCRLLLEKKKGPVNTDFTSTSVGTPRVWVAPAWDLWFAFCERGVRSYYSMIDNQRSTLDLKHDGSDHSTAALCERSFSSRKNKSSIGDPCFRYIAPKAAHVISARPIPSPQYQQALNKFKLFFF